MVAQDIVIVHPDNDEQLAALKEFMTELQIRFEVAQEQVYDRDFVQKIEKSKSEAKEGKLTRVEKQELKAFLGL
jgi:hypothetical protein